MNFKKTIWLIFEIIFYLSLFIYMIARPSLGTLGVIISLFVVNLFFNYIAKRRKRVKKETKEHIGYLNNHKSNLTPVEKEELFYLEH